MLLLHRHAGELGIALVAMTARLIGHTIGIRNDRFFHGRPDLALDRDVDPIRLVPEAQLLEQETGAGVHRFHGDGAVFEKSFKVFAVIGRDRPGEELIAMVAAQPALPGGLVAIAVSVLRATHSAASTHVLDGVSFRSARSPLS